MNILYSFKLKNVSIIDIVIIASGFVLRIIAGGLIIVIELSHWIILTTFTLALFLAIAKRRDDLILNMKGIKARKNLEQYNFEFINAVMLLSAGITIVSYIMYTVSQDAIAKWGTDKLYLTSIFVIVGIIRYLQLTLVFHNSGDPAKIILKDRFLQAIIIMWLLSFYIFTKIWK